MTPLFDPAGKPVLITGGTGFIGSALAKAMAAAGARVRTLDDGSRGRSARLDAARDGIELLEGDIRDPAAVSRAARGVKLVVHLAYVNGTEFFYQRPELVLEVAVKGMMNVLDACREHGVRQLALASSSEVYQHAPRIPTDESVPLVVPDVLNPRFSYGGGKIISELLTINYGRKFFDRVVIFRPHNVYGPDMGNEHVIPQFARRMKQLAREQPAGPVDFPIQGTGRETRSFIFIDDFTIGAMRVIEAGAHLNIYHIGSEEEAEVAEVARLVGEAFGREIRTVPGAIQPGSTPRRCPDVRKLGELGFRARTPLKQGIAKTVAWYKEI